LDLGKFLRIIITLPYIEYNFEFYPVTILNYSIILLALVNFFQTNFFDLKCVVIYLNQLVEKFRILIKFTKKLKYLIT
jgi:hypothetical protein